MSRDLEAAKIDPAHSDGLYNGPSRGHVQPRYAQMIGMPRDYGYGASMGAWILDYLSNWAASGAPAPQQDELPRAGADGRRHLPGRRGRRDRPRPSGGRATVTVVMTNQDDEEMAQGRAEIELPTP